MKLVGELGCEVVKNMGRIARPVQKQESVSLSAPIQIVKFDTVCRGEFGLM